MKKVGNWYIPDSDTGKENLVEFVSKDDFQCRTALEEAFKYVKKFENAIDVGTWIGDSTSIIAKKFNSVKGFEPNPAVYECCAVNIKEHNINNCELFMKGLSNKSGTQKLINKGKTFSGWVSTLPLNEKDSNKAVSVDTCRLDDLKFTDIDFIKIDVDSHEGFLVDGAREFFKSNSPVIMIECKTRVHIERQSKLMPDPLKILKDLNYKIVARIGKADFILVKKEK